MAFRRLTEAWRPDRLETHVQLGTASKIFTAAPPTRRPAHSQHRSGGCWGLPGTLPVLNQKGSSTVKALLALKSAGCRATQFRPLSSISIPTAQELHRSPSSISPIAENGWIEVEVPKRKDTYLRNDRHRTRT